VTDLATRPEISVVVPLYNEADSIQPLTLELVDSLDRLTERWEIIFVDDGSADQTFEQLRALTRSESRIRVVRLTQNFGQTAALQAGFSMARAGIIVSMDGDLQNDPKDLSRVIGMLEEGYDAVSGWRRSRKDTFLTRKVPSWCANWMLSRITGVRLHDTGCALKAYRSPIVARLDLYSDMHRFIPILAAHSGARICEIEVNHRHRRHGTSKYGLSRVWKVLLDIATLVMITRFFNRPGHWFGLLSLPFLFSALLAFGGSVWQYLNPVKAAATTTTVPIVLPGATVLLAFAFFHFILMAIVGELVVFLGDRHSSDAVQYRGSESLHWEGLS